MASYSEKWVKHNGLQSPLANPTPYKAGTVPNNFRFGREPEKVPGKTKKLQDETLTQFVANLPCPKCKIRRHLIVYGTSKVQARDILLHLAISHVCHNCDPSDTCLSDACQIKTLEQWSSGFQGVSRNTIMAMEKVASLVREISHVASRLYYHPTWNHDAAMIWHGYEPTSRPTYGPSYKVDRWQHVCGNDCLQGCIK